MIVSDDFLSDNGYPGETELHVISTWPKDWTGLMEYVHERWNYADIGYWKQRGHLYFLSTGGWSGNEDLIRAMEQNFFFWTMCWYRETRGGHFVFDLSRGVDDR